MEKIEKDAKENIPPGADLVKAPFELKRKNSDISRSFVIYKPHPIDLMTPDIRLETKNALIRSAVYTSDEDWGRPVNVYAKTKNADLVLEIHTLQAHQSVGVRISTKNGRNRALLPRDFKSFLGASTKNGKCTLSKDLGKVAVRLPGLSEKSLDDDESFDFRRSMAGTDSKLLAQISNGVGEEYEINGGGPSEALIDTKNGNFYVGLIQEDQEEDTKISC